MTRRSFPPSSPRIRTRTRPASCAPTDHLRLKNFTIGFTAPKRWTEKIGVNTLRLYAAGNNLLTWKDKMLVVDPEQRGFVAYGTPPLRTVTFGLQVGI